MNFPFKQLAATTLMLAGLAAFTAPAQANITPQQSAEILKAYSAETTTDFRQFLTSLAKSDLARTAAIGPAIGAFLDNKTLTAEQQNEIYRLLGLYARVKYSAAATETLRELVEIPTYRKDGVAQHDNPEFIKIGEKIKSLAESFHLNFRNIDNRVYE
ncbi:dipeptidase, partial [Pseudomonas sp. HMWF005]